MIVLAQTFVVVSATLSLLIAIFFLRFYSQSRDRFFILFALAFASLSLSWFLLTLYVPSAETRHYLYVPRLFAFAFIVVAIIDKNRRAK